jgi:hypothetical protein
MASHLSARLRSRGEGKPAKRGDAACGDAATASRGPGADAVLALQRTAAGNAAVARALAAPGRRLQRQDAGPRIEERPQALEDLRRERERLIDERDHPPPLMRDPRVAAPRYRYYQAAIRRIDDLIARGGGTSILRAPSDRERRGPMIESGEGTTEELRRERERLLRERENPPSYVRDPRVAGPWWAAYTAAIERLNLLIAERGNSTLADAPVELYFDGRTLTMRGAGGVRVWSGVSGQRADGIFDYSPSRQRIHNEGPIPEGVYWLDPAQLVHLQDRFWYFVYERGWGTHRITVHPFDTTRTFGRGGFFIHGGTVAGSAGCIDLTSQMEEFARLLAATPRGHKVKLHVNYGRASSATPGRIPIRSGGSGERQPIRSGGWVGRLP